jgi:hypothetical protein
MKNTDKACDENKISEADSLDNLLDTQNLSVKIDEILDVFNKVSALTEELGQWSKSTVQLFFMEVLRNVNAAKQIFLCQLLFIPLLILFVFSLCVTAGVVAYTITLNILIGFAFFILAMSAVLGGLVFWQKHLMSFLGFNSTLEQLKEAADVISKATK